MTVMRDNVFMLFSRRPIRNQLAVTWPVRGSYWWVGWRGIVVDILSNMALALNERFDTWEEFKTKLDSYCAETYQTSVSKTVESVNKHRKVPFPAELKFAFVRMSCVHYGKKRDQKGKEPTGQRPIQRYVHTDVIVCGRIVDYYYTLSSSPSHVTNVGAPANLPILPKTQTGPITPSRSTRHTDGTFCISSINHRHSQKKGLA